MAQMNHRIELLCVLLLAFYPGPGVNSREAEACYMDALSRTDTLHCSSGLFIHINTVRVGYNHNYACLDEPDFCPNHNLSTANPYFQYLSHLCDGRESCILSSAELKDQSNAEPPIFHACGNESTKLLRNKVEVHYSCINFIPTEQTTAGLPASNTETSTLKEHVMTSDSQQQTTSHRPPRRTTSLSLTSLDQATQRHSKERIAGAQIVIVYPWLGVITALLILIVVMLAVKRKCLRDERWTRLDSMYKGLESMTSTLRSQSTISTDASTIASQRTITHPQTHSTMSDQRVAASHRSSTDEYYDGIDELHQFHDDRADNPAYINAGFGARQHESNVYYSCYGDGQLLNYDSTQQQNAGIYVVQPGMVESGLRTQTV